MIRTATAVVWFYAGADRDRRAVHPDDLTPAAALTIMAESRRAYCRPPSCRGAGGR